MLMCESVCKVEWERNEREGVRERGSEWESKRERERERVCEREIMCERMRIKEHQICVRVMCNVFYASTLRGHAGLNYKCLSLTVVNIRVDNKHTILNILFPVWSNVLWVRHGSSILNYCHHSLHFSHSNEIFNSKTFFYGLLTIFRFYKYDQNEI